MLRTEILHWLRESNPHRLNELGGWPTGCGKTTSAAKSISAGS